MRQLQVLLIALCAIVATATNFGKRVRMEPDVSIFSAPNWAIGERVTDQDMITLRFVLRHESHKVAEFEELLLDISNPKSSNYGKWLTIEQVTEKLAPPDRNLFLVKEFLSSFGVTDVIVNSYRDMIRVEIPATLAEKMFETIMHKFQFVDSDITVIRVSQPYSLPEDIAEVVSFVDDLIRLPRFDTQKLTSITEEEALATSSWTSCGSSYSSYTNPAVLQERYGYPTLTSAASGNSMAVVEFQNQYYDTTDLQKFSSQCGIDTVTVSADIGTNDDSYCTGGFGLLSRCIESLLDIEYIGAVAQPIPLTVYYYSSYSLLDWIEDVSNDASAPLVQSVSYGNDEAQQTSNDYMYSCNTYFMTVGARGISILFASGDQGVWGREGTTGNVFHPDFPAGSPYITAVGGTDFVTKSTVGDETAWSAGGGGFSNTFPIPSYQSEAVASFKANSTSLPSSSYYNNSGRGYPDVSALAGQVNPYFISYKGGSFTAVAGTSAACPVVAGIFAQLNDIRLQAGKSSLGFLNQFIYQNADAFNDVTSGTNDDSESAGFTAIAGWDAATGMGTPNFDKLSALVASI
uniref:subtilisin n=1 Tax=Actinophrys sol TaxID=238771 RepID=A8QWY7_9STRA|nr:sedolisin-like peptidase [Actinophrys sol]